MNCNRKNPHAGHAWVEYPNQAFPYKCEGVPGSTEPQRIPLRFTLGEDARGGDLLELDEKTGLLRRYREPLPDIHGSMDLQEAEQFAWPFYELIAQRQAYVPGTFAQHADACMAVLDEMEARR